MPVYVYKAFSADGQQQRGELQAHSEADLFAQLKRQGLALASAEEKGSGTGTFPIFLDFFQPRLSNRQWSELLDELSNLVRSGITIAEALHLLAGRRNPRTSAGKFLRHTHQALLNGEALSQSFKGANIEVPEIVKTIIVAGETRGNLAGALKQLAALLSQRAEVEEKLRSMMIYPIILLALSVIAIAIIVVFLVPNLLPLFEGTGVQPPFILQFLAFIAGALEQHWQILTITLCLCLLAFLYALRTKKARILISTLLLRLPIFGELNRQRNSAMFARLLSTLLASDVPPAEALAVSANVLPNPLLAKCAKEIRQAVMDGEAFSESLQRVGRFCPLLTRFASIGETTGKLDELLLHYAETTDVSVARLSERLMALLTPILTIAIGLFVGSLILSVLQAILSVNNLALQ